MTPSNEQDTAQVQQSAEALQEATRNNVQVAYVNAVYTGERTVEDAQGQDIRLEVVKPANAKHGFGLLLRRWGVERSFAWTARFRNLARGYERLPKTLAGLHLVAFAIAFAAHIV